MNVAVMQPYFFPYIGYFQLIKSVDKFVFYDDVNFIKNGWINRNRILVNSRPTYLTVRLKNASSYKLIKEIEFIDDKAKIYKTLMMAYKKAPYFNQVLPIISQCLECNTNRISELAIYSVQSVCSYLGIKTIFEKSSISHSDSSDLDRSVRLLQICKNNNADTYINTIGGQKLYNKETFEKEGVKLQFIESKEIIYPQFKSPFIPWLSIIDVLMFNSPIELNEMLTSYNLK